MGYAVALIGGTGVAQELLRRCPDAVHVPTRFGLFRARGLRREGILALARHGERHETPPHAINYSAIAEGLRRLGVQWVFSSAAVGSLDPNTPPGTLVVCSDLIGFFHGFFTFHQEEVVHTDFRQPFEGKARSFLLDSARRLGVSVVEGGVYVSMPGPRYETPAEVRSLQVLGGTVVGMTVGKEAIFLKEAGLSYACLAVVTNWASGIGGEPLTHSEVVAVMRKQAPLVSEILWSSAEQARGEGLV
jgi:5'-methylthioadenosine phosphorylase